ncbi:MAG: hypothetical protein QOE53_2289 [Pseudonocardiales bacterium]|jgi:hypothetical protein|nr:hypothetical protein [Pseudonocardiales bacterium]
MTVVVNEFDVVPLAPARDAAEPAPAGPAETGRLSPASTAELERAVLVRAERRERLEAY